jgi:flavin reductase (DIM6/NTAB) family NADH-FMN oxidoreductase RutF
MATKVVGIGNCSGSDVEKFAKFKLTALDAETIGAPLIKECYANFECKVVDTRLVRKHNFFILEVKKAHVATSPKYPRTIHYRGDGIFMVSGRSIDLSAKFRRGML